MRRELDFIFDMVTRDTRVVSFSILNKKFILLSSRSSVSRAIDPNQFHPEYHLQLLLKIWIRISLPSLGIEIITIARQKKDFNKTCVRRTSIKFTVMSTDTS